MTIEDYLIDASGLDWPSLLAEWQWLLPDKVSVWLLTRAGDLVLTFADGSIHFLDVGGGALRELASSRNEFCNRVDEPGVAADVFMIPVVDQLVAAGTTLGPGECYSFRKLPILGGAYAADNRIPLPIREHLGLWGSVHRQIADLPDGSQVEMKWVD